jgi:NAD(P)-dependent dehydrogenase (short-subunit alcohol dehydrogenase family)
MIPTEYDLTGKSVIISGAARGIGKGIVRVFTEARAKVMVTALTDKYLTPLVEELTEAGTPIETLTADATNEEEWNRTVAKAIERFGHIDVLVNTLGDAVMKPVVPRPDQETDQPFTEDDWNFIMDVNLKGVFLGCKAVGPHFLERQQGKIINIGAWVVRRNVPGYVVWSAAKAAVHKLTESFSAEWGPYGVNVNGIATGGFPDPETNPPEILAFQKKWAGGQVPLGGRPGTLREAGLAALFFASDASSFLTGERCSILMAASAAA